MIFFTSLALGIATGSSRSVVAMALVAIAIPAAFLLALTLGSAPGFGGLLAAILGYNMGLFNLLLLAVVRQRQKTA